MEKRFELLDYRASVLGDLILRRRKLAMLDDEIIYEVILNDEFLMSSLFHAAEDALADLGVRASRAEALDVVVGGLGLGYTAAAALAHERVKSLIVVDFLAPVIEWHRGGLLPLGQQLSEDPRLRYVEGDFFALAQSSAGFDPQAPGRKFEAILLDIDHTPKHWLNPRHAAFYTADGLRGISRHLRRGGVFAMWSDGEEDADFLGVLREVFAEVKAHTVSFPNPIQEIESSSTVYVALLPAPTGG